MMLVARLGVGALCLLPLLLPSLASGQSSPDPDFPAPIVAEVRFEGNEFFSDEVLAVQVRTRANRRFLEIPGARWWLWLYRLGESGKLGRRLSRGLMASGEAPAFLDTALVAVDAERLRTFYRQEGFREAEVGTQIDTLQGGRAVRVRFMIERGAPTFVRTVRYEGVDALPPEERAQLVRTSYLHPPRTSEGDSLAFRPRGQRYSEPVLQLERQRVLAFLRDQGYAAISRDSIRALVVPSQPDSFDVTFRIETGPRYRFGAVRFEVTGPEEEAARTDTIGVVTSGPADTVGVIAIRIEDEGKLNTQLLERSLQFRPGDFYNQSLITDTKRQLEGTGVFSYTNIAPTRVDSAEGLDEPLLRHRIDLRTRRRHQVRLESFIIQRTGVVSGSEGELGVGAGATYQNVNFLGGGETFQVSVTGTLGENFQSPQAEVTASLTYPYLTWPAGPLERALDLYDARTRFSLSLLTARRRNLGLIIRGRGAARARLELDHSPTVSSLIDLPDFTLNNPDTLTGFRELFLNKIIGLNAENGDTTYAIDDPVQRAQIIENYTVPSVNSAARYTLRSLNTNPLLRNRGYSFDGSVEVGGNLLHALDEYVFTPDTLEGSLPGLPIFRGDRLNNRLVYRRYVRLLADYRRYVGLSRSRIFAWRVAAGVAQPYGGSNQIPLDRRFYSGGASGVRGWDPYDLGPGPLNSKQGGEIRLETGAELRIRFLRDLFGAQWSYAPFVDAGNVWLGPRSPGQEEAHFRFDRFYKQIGVGSGVGLRIAWEFFVARFDLAYRLYDPSYRVPPDPVTGEPGRVHGFFSDGTPILHFGIGHAF